MDLIQHQNFSSPFVKLVCKGEYTSLGEVEVVKIYIKAIARIAILLTDKVEKKGCFPDTAKPFDADDPGTPVDLMVELPDDPIIAGIDQKFMRFEKMFHLKFVWNNKNKQNLENNVISMWQFLEMSAIYTC